MYAILAEDESDAEVLTAVIRRHFNNDGIKIKKKGYEGCSRMRAKARRSIFVVGCRNKALHNLSRC